MQTHETEDTEELSEDPEPGGFLDIMAEAEERQDELPSSLEAVGKRIVALGALSEQSAEELRRSDEAGKGMRGRLAIATKYVAGLDRIAGEIEADVAKYVSDLSTVSAGNLELIKNFESDPTQLAEHMDFAMAVRRTAHITRESLAALAEMVEGIKENAKISRVLQAPSQKLTEALDRFVDATSAIDEWDRRLQSLGVPMPPEDWESDSDTEDAALSDSADGSTGGSQDDDADPKSSDALERERRRVVAERDAAILAGTEPDPELAGLAEHIARLDRDL